MFEKNMLTFNPGWDSNAQPVDRFTDVRERQRKVKAKGSGRLQGSSALAQGRARLN